MNARNLAIVNKLEQAVPLLKEREPIYFRSQREKLFNICGQL